MDRQEMLERLDNGESPLDVSIQKWKDVITDISGGIDLGLIEYHFKTCALCELHFEGSYCETCPYEKYYNHNCAPWNESTAWVEFDYAIQNNNRVEALKEAKNMVAELEAIKNAKKDN